MQSSSAAHLLSMWRPLEYTGRNFRIVEEVAGSENTFLVEKISTGKVYELFQHEVTMEEIEFQELAASVADGIVAEVRELAVQEGDTSISMLDDSDIDVPEAAVRGRIASGLIDATVPHHAIVTRLEQYFAEMHLQQQAAIQQEQQQQSVIQNNIMIEGTSNQGGDSGTAAAGGGGGPSYRNRPNPPSGPLTMDALLADDSHGFGPMKPHQSQATAEDRGTDTAPLRVGVPPQSSSKFYCPVQRIIDTWVCEVGTSHLNSNNNTNLRPGSPSGPKMVSLCVNVVQEHVPYTLHSLASVRHELSPHASSHVAHWTALETKTISQSILFVNAALDDLCAEGFVAEQYGPLAVPVASLDTTTVGCRTTGDLLLEACKVRIGAFASIPTCSLPPCVSDWEARYPRSVWESNHREVVAVLYGLGHAPRSGGATSPRSGTSTTATSPMVSPKNSSINLLRSNNNNTITPHVSYHLVSRLNKFTVAMFLLDMLRQVPEEEIGGDDELRSYPSLGVTTSTGRYHAPPPALPTTIQTSIFKSRFMLASEVLPPSSSSINEGRLSTEPPSGGGESTQLLLLVRSMIVALLGGGGGDGGDSSSSSASSKPPFDSLPLDALAKMCSIYPTPTAAAGGKKKQRGGAGIPKAVEEHNRQYALNVWQMCTTNGGGGSIVAGGSSIGGGGGGTMNMYDMSLGRPNTAASSSWGSMQRSSRPATTSAKPPTSLRLRSGRDAGGVSLPTGTLQRPTSTILGYHLDGTINTDTSSERIVASVGIEEVRHVYYCSSFDYEAHYNNDGGRRRRQFYEGYHQKRYPRGTVPRAPPAVFSVKPPTHSIPCHSWSHEEAIANLHRKQQRSGGTRTGSSSPRGGSPRALTSSSPRIPSRPTTSGSNTLLTSFSSRPGTSASSRPIWANHDYDEQYASAKKEKKESTIDYSKRLRTGAREKRTASALLNSLEKAQVSEMGSGVVLESPRRSSARHTRSSSVATPAEGTSLPLLPLPGSCAVSINIKGSHNRFYPSHVAAKLPSSSSPRRSVIPAATH